MDNHDFVNEHDTADTDNPKKHLKNRGHRAKERLLRFELLESRRLMAGDTVQFGIPGSDLVATPGEQTFGVNALPATDIPNDLPNGTILATALPWMVADGSMSFVPGGAAGVALRTPSLEAGVLGNFAQLWRGSYGAITEVPKPPQEDVTTPETPQAGLQLDLDIEDVLTVLATNR
ncbi:MAG TPA: hypothetical protein VGJ26_06490 [Pirellulales bacterium]|jgi:hypothetical protein